MIARYRGQQNEYYQEIGIEGSLLRNSIVWDYGLSFHQTHNYSIKFRNFPTLKMPLMSTQEVLLNKKSKLMIWQTGFKKIFNNSIYFSTWPFSIRRFSYKLHLSNFIFTQRENLWDGLIGLDLDVLAFHTAPVKISVEYSKEFNTKDTQVFVGLSAKY